MNRALFRPDRQHSSRRHRRRPIGKAMSSGRPTSARRDPEQGSAPKSAVHHWKDPTRRGEPAARLVRVVHRPPLRHLAQPAVLDRVQLEQAGSGSRTMMARITNFLVMAGLSLAPAGNTIPQFGILYAAEHASF